MCSKSWCREQSDVTNRFTLLGRLRSVQHALHGLGVMLRGQHNAWIHAAATVAVVTAGVVLRKDAEDWRWIIVAVVAVWIAEALNTALELLADATAPQRHPLIGQAKDVAAGAVLLAALGAAVIGVLVLGPPLVEALRGFDEVVQMVPQNR